MLWFVGKKLDGSSTVEACVGRHENTVATIKLMRTSEGRPLKEKVGRSQLCYRVSSIRASCAMAHQCDEIMMLTGFVCSAHDSIISIKVAVALCRTSRPSWKTK